MGNAQVLDIRFNPPRVVLNLEQHTHRRLVIEHVDHSTAMRAALLVGEEVVVSGLGGHLDILTSWPQVAGGALITSVDGEFAEFAPGFVAGSGRFSLGPPGPLRDLATKVVGFDVYALLDLDSYTVLRLWTPDSGLVMATSQEWTLKKLKEANKGRTYCERCGMALREEVFFQDRVLWCPKCEKELG